jgi:hypothetical protein
MRCYTWAIITLIAISSEATAHYSMLLPDRHSVKKGEKVTFVYQWGHPYEHALSDAPWPKKLIVIPPGGKELDLLPTLEAFKQAGADGKDVTSYRFHFTPEQRGDYTFLLRSAPLALDDDKEKVTDIVRVVLHVQTHGDWWASAEGESIDFSPLTRPYGLLPGMVFQARASWTRPSSGGSGVTGGGVQIPWGQLLPANRLEGVLVEFERYNAQPPKETPDDELITFKTITNLDGVATLSLPEPGWWAITLVPRPYRVDNSKPPRTRATIWVYVNEKK